MLKAFTITVWSVVAELAVLACTGCGEPTRAEWTELAYPTARDVYRDYYVDGVTPGGVRYQGVVDESRLDDIVADTCACLSAGPTRIDPQYVAAHAQCLHREIRLPEVSDFVVVVAPPYEVDRQTCHTVEGSALPDYDAYYACQGKDITPGLDCPCAWRGLFREASDNTPLLVVAELENLPDVLTRWATVCRNPWASDFPLKSCAAPAPVQP